MSISRLSSDVLNQVVSFLPQENAHACAGVCKQLNRLIHMGAFARMQIDRLFPDQNSALPVAEYQKLVRIFSNLAVGRCGYSAHRSNWECSVGDSPNGVALQPSLSLGAFTLTTYHQPGGLNIERSYGLNIERRGVTTARIKMKWGEPDSWEIQRNPLGRVSLYSTLETGVFFIRADRARFSDIARLNFSQEPEDILFHLHDILTPDAGADRPDVIPSQSRMALSPQDENGIYQELWFLNREEAGNRYVDYGRMAFEKQQCHRPDHYSVPNKDRAEAILHYSMRLIARRYAAPHGDPLAETMFNRLPVALRNPVYGELYTIKRPSQGEDVWNYGELAFHGRLGTVTNLERRAAILNFVDKGQKVM